MKTTISLSLVVLALAVSTSSAQSPYEHRSRGLALGALMGGLTGGAIGNNNGETAAGAAIGAVVGGLTGAAIGDSVDQDIAWDRARTQQQYNAQLNAQMSRAVTPQDVISMSQSRLAESVIITQIQASGVAYRPQSQDLIMMSNAGVSPNVIQSMQTAPLAGAAAAPAPAPVYRDNVVVERYHYVAPRYYCPPPYYPYHRPRPHPHHHGSSVHWGFSFGN
jgi:uncharacterized membrane protein